MVSSSRPKRDLCLKRVRAVVRAQDFGRQAGQVLFSDVFFRHGRRWGERSHLLFHPQIVNHSLDYTDDLITTQSVLC